MTGAFDSARDAQALAKIVCDDDEYAHLQGNPEERGRGEGRVKAEGSPGPSSVSGDVWLATLARLANSPFVRVTRVGKANGGDDGSKDLDTAAEQVDGKDTYAARLLARVSTCNHSCRPNAAVSVSDDLVTLYSLRRIGRREITVSYGTSLLWLPLQMRRTQLARVWGFVCKCQRCETDLHRAMAERERAHGTMRRVASRHGFREIGSFQTRHDDLAGVIEWEYGETGFESQFDEEGRVRGTILDGSRADEGGVGVNGRKMAVRAGGGADSDTSDSSDTDTSSFDSSDDSSSSDEGFGRRGRIRRSGGGKMRGGSVKAMGPARLYNRLVKAGIGPDHWQMHATREVLVSRLLSKEGRKDFDLDLLLEHANCAARLAPNHPHFIRLASLVEEVFRTNREVIEAEQYWLWTIDLLREAIHPDVLFWNTEFKGLPPGRVDR